MIQAAIPWLMDGLLVFGLVMMTIAVLGALRFPDTYLRLHAASKIGVVGILPILIVAAAWAPIEVLLRILLIGALLLLTAPVSTHAIGRAAYFRREPLYPPDALDESRRLPEEDKNIV